MDAFLFVAISGRPDLRESKAERLKIRRHAMRSVAVARRQRGDYGQHNRRQLPIFLQSAATKETDPAFENKSETPPPEVACKLLTNPSSQGYEAARIRHGFDILSLSALTSVYLSRHSVQILCSKPQQLQNLMGLREASWLDFVPSQYPESRVLQLAVDCTMAQAHRLLYPNAGSTEAAVIRLYLKALAQLQVALLNERQWARPDVLCATQILAFYEVSDFALLS